MVKRFFIPIMVLLAIAILAASAVAQQTGLEQEAEDRRIVASTLLDELNARTFNSSSAQDSLMLANNAFDDGMQFYDSGNWQAAIDSFDNASYLGGEAVAYEEVGDVIGLDFPWGDGIDLDDIGQGVRSSDFPILLGIIFVSVFIILPVTYVMV